MTDMAILDHIAIHSIQVSLVATKLVDIFSDRGLILNRDLVRSASLLHDITKTRSLKTGENHAATGSELIRSLGYPDVARLVAQHVRLERMSGWSEPPREEEIVNYADKRVLHDEIRPLEDRRHYIMKRYGTEPARRIMIQNMFEDSFRLEERLFRLLDLSPLNLESLVERINDSWELKIYRAFAPLQQQETDNGSSATNIVISPHEVIS